MRRSLQLSSLGRSVFLYAASQSSASNKHTDIVYFLSQAPSLPSHCSVVDFSTVEDLNKQDNVQALMQMHIGSTEPEATVLWHGGDDRFQKLHIGHLMMELAARCAARLGKRLELVEAPGRPWLQGSLYEELGFIAAGANSSSYASLSADPQGVIDRVTEATRAFRQEPIISEAQEAMEMVVPVVSPFGSA